MSLNSSFRAAVLVQQMGTFEILKTWIKENAARVDVYIYPEIQEKMKNAGVNYRVFDTTHSQFSIFPFEQYSALIGGTLSYRTDEHAQMIELARRKKLKTFLLIDNWSYMAERFQHACHPDGIFVIDQVMADLIKKHDNGTPLIEVGLREYPTRTDFSETPRILFITEPFHSRTPDHIDADLKAYDVFLNFLSALKAQNQKFTVALRPHPRDTSDRLNRMIQKAQEVSLNVELDLSSKEDSLKNADYVVGLTSIFLVESSLAGIKTVSIQTEPEPLGSHMRGRRNLKIANHLTDMLGYFKIRNIEWPGQTIKSGQINSILNQHVFGGLGE